MSTFRKAVAHILQDEDGAVTVDWVVLTAAITGIGAIIVLSVRDGATELAGKTEASLTAAEVAEFPTY